MIHVAHGSLVNGKEERMAASDFAGIAFDDPRLQAAFEQLLQAVAAAEREREPVAQRHRQAEHELDRAVISDAQFRRVDDAYIAANNRIAAAKRAVDAFLAQNRAYRVT